MDSYDSWEAVVSGGLERIAYPWSRLSKCKYYATTIVFIIRINALLSVLFRKEMHDLLLKKKVLNSWLQSTVTYCFKLILWSKPFCCRKARCH